VGKLKALNIMCKRDTESVKVAPESVLSNRGESRRYTLDRAEFSADEVFAGGLSPGFSLGDYPRTPQEFYPWYGIGMGIEILRYIYAT